MANRGFPDKRAGSSNPGLVAERPMYFAYYGWVTGGHDTMGATTTSMKWYFAGGHMGLNFDEWACVLNPGDTDTVMTFYFQTQ